MSDNKVITAQNPIIRPVPSLHLGNMPYADIGDDDETLRKAQQDREAGASAQYVNFPKEIPNEARELLVAYERAILAYRSWASLRWWKTTFASPSVPQVRDYFLFLYSFSINSVPQFQAPFSPFQNASSLLQHPG